MALHETCVTCGSDALRRVPGFERFQRVTSDCKPWPSGGSLRCCQRCGTAQKEIDASWLADIDAIYRAYDLFALSSGEEQVIFTGRGEPRPRSEILVELIAAQEGLPPTGRLLDIGCGTGAALGRFSKALPDWRLFGHELSDKVAPLLKQLLNFDELYLGELGEIPGKFDIITIIHALEHIVDPLETLRAAVDLLAPGGLMLIEVPDLETSPYDLLIADHRTHFTTQTLGYLVAKAGLAATTLSNGILPKELTVIGTRRVSEPVVPDQANGRVLLETTSEWLSQVQQTARELSANEPIGIFGTSISGTWCFSEIQDRVAFFVDEDKTRVGRTYHDLPIYSPEEAPAGSTVYVPLAPGIAEKVAARLNGRGARFVSPAPFEAASRTRPSERFGTQAAE